MAASGAGDPAPAPTEPPAPAKSAGPRRSPARSPSRGPVTAAADAGAGIVLAVLFWGWVALPFMVGGPDRVKAVLKAKFLNKAADGSWLP